MVYDSVSCYKDFLFSLNFYNFGYSAHSGNRKYCMRACRIVSYFYNCIWCVCDAYTICVCS
jgi:hypothetical protein